VTSDGHKTMALLQKTKSLEDRGSGRRAVLVAALAGGYFCGCGKPDASRKETRSFLEISQLTAMRY